MLPETCCFSFYGILGTFSLLEVLRFFALPKVFGTFSLLEVLHIFAIPNVLGTFSFLEVLPGAYTKKYLSYAPFPFYFPLFRTYKATFFPYTKKLIRHTPHSFKNGAHRTNFSIYSTFLRLITKKTERNGLFFSPFFIYARPRNQVLYLLNLPSKKPTKYN